MTPAIKRKKASVNNTVTEDKSALPKAVILAADREEGLIQSRNRYPKPLTPILNIPLLERILKTLQRAGITQTIIVTGYLSQTIRKQLGNGSKLNMEIKYTHNREYAQGPTTSLKTARKHLSETEPFLLVPADTLFNAKIIKKALDNINHTPLLCVDFRPRYSRQTKNATKVLVNKEGHITKVGKDIYKWNAISTGILLLNNTTWNTVDQTEENTQPQTTTEHIQHLISKNNTVWACDVSNHFWFHIDTSEDAKFVEHLLSGSPRSQN